MLSIGCHLSKSKGYYHMGLEAVSIDANTFQFFSRNPRGGKAKKIDRTDVNKFLKLVKEENFDKILVHAPYTMNPCSKDPSIRLFAKNTMIEDLRMMEYFPGNMYNFHPGNHVNQGVEKGVGYISAMLNQVLNDTQDTTVLLETMAGKGTEIGKSFTELATIIDHVDLDENLGVCLDTCHIFDGGYDIVNDLDDVLDEFDNIIGLNQLHAVHLNDSVHGLGSHKDRHACIGEGKIGLDSIVNIINHKKLYKLPFYLETPNEISGFKKEIKILRDLYKK